MAATSDQRAVAERTRRGWFATKAARGRFLAAVAVALFALNTACGAWSSWRVDRRVDARVEEIRTALAGRRPIDLLIAVEEGGRLPGGPYALARPSGQAFDADVEVRAGVASRCIRVHLAAGGEVTTSVDRRSCH